MYLLPAGVLELLPELAVTKVATPTEACSFSKPSHCISAKNLAEETEDLPTW